MAAYTFSKKTKKMSPNSVSKKNCDNYFWDNKGVILGNFLEQGSTINAESYGEQYKTSIGKNLDDFDWEVFDHPPHSPDVAPSDDHLFPVRRLGSQHSTLIDAELQWLRSQAVVFHRA
ncbi:hypothetical protein J6590_011838 [Homalodisca vitripennis]|nr:hypothetical protein J6590_011838 [Homalodisca vitripennis]